jgi:RNA polymerase sigma factor (sigma-70 family)
MPNHPPSPSPDDLSDLAARAARGDAAAFQRLHHRLNAGLRRLLSRRTHDAALIDDLLQQTWTGVWEALSSGRYDPSRAAISTFVYAVASHTWLRYLRRVRPMESHEEDKAPDLYPDTADEAELAESLDMLRKALDGRLPDLTEQERWIIRLAAQGAGDRTIAERLRISPSTANQAKQAALGKLRRLLARKGLRPPDAERKEPSRQ